MTDKRLGQRREPRIVSRADLAIELERQTALRRRLVEAGERHSIERLRPVSWWRLDHRLNRWLARRIDL